MHELVAAGADVIELASFSPTPWPMGPVIQQAIGACFAPPVSLAQFLEMVRSSREHQTTPVVLMGYLNPVERMLMKSFADAALAFGSRWSVDRRFATRGAEGGRSAVQARRLDVILLSPQPPHSRLPRSASTPAGYV